MCGGLLTYGFPLSRERRVVALGCSALLICAVHLSSWFRPLLGRPTFLALPRKVGKRRQPGVSGPLRGCPALLGVVGGPSTGPPWPDDGRFGIPASPGYAGLIRRLLRCSAGCTGLSTRTVRCCGNVQPRCQPPSATCMAPARAAPIRTEHDGHPFGAAGWAPCWSTGFWLLLSENKSNSPQQGAKPKT